MLSALLRPKELAVHRAEMRSMRVSYRIVLGLAGVLCLPSLQAYAQDMTRSARPGMGQVLAQASPTQVAQARSKGSGQAAQQASSSGELRQRVEQLEEQILDMQVVVGTLESLARNAGGASPSMTGAPIGSGADSARIDALETQVRALTAQIEQLSDQIRALSGGTGVETRSVQRERSVERESLSAGSSTAVAANPEVNFGFGATIIRRGEDSSSSDPIGEILREEVQPESGSQYALAAPGDPKQEYEVAYGYLLQQNYSAAEQAFQEFLQRYPNDPLAGNAQYWLGETFYVRGQYKAAASAFLKGYQNYGNSAKAPDSLLKLAMSLDRLGQKEAACSSFDELEARFPNAPSHVKTRALTERQRVGC